MLHQIRIASPCSADWEQMKGDDQVRFCAQCNRNVYDFSQMKNADISAFIDRQNGRVCGRFYQRSDPKLSHREKHPLRLGKSIRFVSQLAGTALLATMSIVSTSPHAIAQTSSIQVHEEKPKVDIFFEVLDAMGAIIENAQISFSLGGEVKAYGTTNQKGEWQTQLTPGKYSVTVKCEGFSPNISEITVAGNKAMHVEVVLHPGFVGEVVSIPPHQPGFFSKLGHKLGLK